MPTPVAGECAIATMPAVGVVIVSWNVRDLLARCLDSVRRSEPQARIVVVDNASTDGTAAMVRERFPDVALIANADNAGFSRGNNQGLEHLGVRCSDARAAAAGAIGAPDHGGAPDVVLLLNPDAELVGDALAVMSRALASEPRVACVGPRLEYPDGRPQSSCRRFPSVATAMLESTPLEWHWPRNPAALRYRMADAEPVPAGAVDWVTGAAMLLRTAALRAVGGFDESLFMYSEEMDLCRRLRSGGWDVRYEPGALVVHHEAASSGQVPAERHVLFQRSRVRYYRKHHGAVAAWLVDVTVRAQFACELAVEGAKWLAGHRRELRADRMRSYRAVIARRDVRRQEGEPICASR